MDDHNFSFENLKVYSLIRELIRDVYNIQRQFPREEMFALGDQIRRASISIASNLAEGSGRDSIKEKIHFIEISYGSLMEVYSQLQLSVDLDYIGEDSFSVLRQKIINIAKMLSGLKTSFSRKLPSASNSL